MAGKDAEKPNDDKRTLNAKVDRKVWRALRVHCAVRDVDQAGIVNLALQRFIESSGDPAAKRVLQEG